MRRSDAMAALLLYTAVLGIAWILASGSTLAAGWGAAFHWRYVLLAMLAGIFYGRVWRSSRRVLTSAITHTLVDVTWSLWFR